MACSEVDRRWMQRALDLAAEGRGFVEPNPMVGCVIAAGDRKLAEGYHAKFGEAHAEIIALSALPAACDALADATMYVTLEPCCHHGKTPPCTDAILNSGIRRLVVGMRDPFREVSGHGLATLQQAGLQVEVGVMEESARSLNAPYLKLLQTGRPWVIGKWAMTLDGKIASATGDSRWISNATSRALTHQLRGRVDGIVVGSRTAARDDPLLTARPSCQRVATRIVLDSHAQTSLTSQLVTTADHAPVFIAAGPDATADACLQLSAAGCEVWQSVQQDCSSRLLELLDELGRRRFTNLLIEGGGELLGNVMDLNQLDEVHVFIAPKLLGGTNAPSPMAGIGIAAVEDAVGFEHHQTEIIDGDIYVHGQLRRP